MGKSVMTVVLVVMLGLSLSACDLIIRPNLDLGYNAGQHSDGHDRKSKQHDNRKHKDHDR